MKNQRESRISSISESIECNVSPYTAFELENANHIYELPTVHKEHLIHADQDREFEFKIQRI
jgi:beta-galactosidase